MIQRLILLIDVKNCYIYIYIYIYICIYIVMSRSYARGREFKDV